MNKMATLILAFAISCALSCIAIADDSMAIVVGSEPGIVERFAAEELQGYLEEICGRKVPVQAEKTDGINLIIATAKNEGDLGDDGFVIQSEGNDLLLGGGGPRGKLYAVYEFLEKYLGVRWFGSDTSDEVIPQRSIEEICAVIKNGIRDKQVPSFYFRETASTLGGPDSVSTLGKLRFNTVNCGWGGGKDLSPELRKRGMDLIVRGHETYRVFLPPKKQFIEHPEWSTFYKGKRVGLDVLGDCRRATFCTTNKEALSIFLENIATYVKERPAIKYLYPWPSDAAVWCECENCRKYSVPDRLLILDEAIAKTVKKVRPDMTVVHFAYFNHMEPPEKLRPSAEMAVSFCGWGRNFEYSFADEGSREAVRRALIGWSEICSSGGNSLFIHSKHMRLYGIGFVLMPLAVTQRDMQHFKKLGVDGLDLGGRGAKGWWLKALNDTVVAKLAWDCNADVEAIINDYFQTYWEPVGKEVKEVFLSVKKALPNRGYWQLRTNPNLYHTNLEITPPLMATPKRTFKKEFLDKVQKYNDNSIAVLGDSLKTVRRLRAEAKGPVVPKRLGKLETAFQYVLFQREAVGFFIDLQEKRRRFSSGTPKNLQILNDMVADIADATEIEEKIKAMCIEDNRRSGVLWDDGQTRFDVLEQWREEVEKLKKTL